MRSSPPSPGAGSDSRGLEAWTDGVWFGPAERPTLGWLSHPAGMHSASGVAVLAPVGYAYWSTHRTLRVISEQLAGAGHLALRFDYDGTGDSAGDQWDPGRVGQWRATVATAVAYLRTIGCSRITLVGVQLGATFALLDGEALDADQTVAWAPVTSGRRLAKEIRLLSSPVPESEDPLDPPGTRVMAGSVFSAQTLTELGRLSLTELAAAPPEALIVDDPAGSATALVERLRAVGAEVRHVQLEGGEQTLETAPEFALVPGPIVERICGSIGTIRPIPGPPPRGRPWARLTWRGAKILEEALRIGEHAHVGVLTTPADLEPHPTTLVLLNPGSETHVGPGRAWVEYARDLAALGHRSVRVDFRGWGESPDEARAPGRPYDACCEQDTVEIVDGLAAAGHQRVAVFGLCASAWIILRAVLRAPVAGAIALNPQMYWAPGDPVDIDWERIRARRAAEIERVERGHQLGVWTALDVLGHRPRVVRWLEDLAATGLPIELLFSEGDDGLVYLRQRAGRRLARIQRAGAVRVRELPGVDHPMHRTWVRPRVARALHEALIRIDESGPTEHPPRPRPQLPPFELAESG